VARKGLDAGDARALRAITGAMDGYLIHAARDRATFLGARIRDGALWLSI
jgi:hypothetical protein